MTAGHDGPAGRSVAAEARGSELRLGFALPGWSIRAVFAAIALGVCAMQGVPGFWLAVVLLLTGAAVVVPRWLTAWPLIAVLSFTVLLVPGAARLRDLLLVAALHLLHLCASWMLVVPPTASVQPSALLGSARRFVLIQVPVQLLGVVVLWLSGAMERFPAPVLAVLAGAAVVGLVLVLAGPLLRRPGD